MPEAQEGRRGLAPLRRVFDHLHGPTLTRSEAEERLLALVRAARLPPPELNVRVRGHEVDLLWREARLVVEVDGYAYHSGRAAFERDRLRDAELQAKGFTVMRVTWKQIVSEPEALLVRLALRIAL
jgi:very-short-patch-repair endonuclease